MLVDIKDDDDAEFHGNARNGCFNSPSKLPPAAATRASGVGDNNPRIKWFRLADVGGTCRSTAKNGLLMIVPSELTSMARIFSKKSADGSVDSAFVVFPSSVLMPNHN